MAEQLTSSVFVEVRRGLVDLAARRREAERARAEVMAGIADLLRVGAARAVPISHMADWAGLTRQTVYDLLADQDQA